MAQRYPGKMTPQVAPLARFPGVSFLVTHLIIGTVWGLSVLLGAHWFLVPGLWGGWILTAIPHGYAHLIADNIFKDENITDWAGPIPNMLIVLAFYFSPFSLIGGFSTTFSNFGNVVTNNSQILVFSLTYALNLWGVFQHLFLPWPSHDPDTGLFTKLLIRKFSASRKVQA